MGEYSKVQFLIPENAQRIYYIHKVEMLDLFTILVPLFSGLTLLSLLALKLAIKDNVTLTRIYEKNQEVYHQHNQNRQQSPTKNALKHLLLNFTPLEIVAVRRAKYKLSLFLSISIITIATSFVPSPFAFVATGTIVYFAYFFMNKALTHAQQGEGNKKYRQKYLQITFGILTVVLNLVMIGRVYKNYFNSSLSAFLGNAGLNIVLDNFLVRPFMTLVIGLPLSRSTSVQEFISQNEKQVVLLETYDVIGQKQMLIKPKKMISPSKIPRSIPLELQIQPEPLNYPQNRDQAYERPIDMLKRIKKEKLLPPINLNLHQVSDDVSSNNLLNSTKKEQESQLEDIISEPKTDNKIESEETEFPTKRKVISDNMIMINPSQNEPIENEEDIEEVEGNKENKGQDHYSSYGNTDILRGSRRGATFNVGDDPLKISLASSEHPTSRQEPLRICLNGEVNLDLQENQSEQDQDIDDYRRRKDMMTIQQSKNPFGVLEIKQQHNHSDEIEEIDFNSPERRRRQQVHVEYEQESKLIKKKKKKLSHDHGNHRVIKFSTGEPYLEYLPNMLSKETKNKKSQALSRKEPIPDSRVVNSVRRPNKKKVLGENNENIMPEFRIQQL